MLPDPVNFILQLDRLIDEHNERGDENALMLAIATLLAQAANADLALFVIPEEAQPATLSLRAVVDRRQILARLEEFTPSSTAENAGALRIETKHPGNGNETDRSIAGLISQLIRERWHQDATPLP